MAFADELVNLKAIFTSLIEALDLSDPYTRGHSDRVGMLATALGMELGLEKRDLEILQDASVLHDIGKIGVRKELLNKPGRFTPEEFEEMKSHVLNGYTILKPLGIPELLDITLLHHERTDGKGYPYGLTDYPLLVRVLQLADVWDALTSDRPYRAAMPPAEARTLMAPESGAFAFDAQILQTFLRLTRMIYPDSDCKEDELEQVLREIEASDFPGQFEAPPGSPEQRRPACA
jgi:putative two-component system response regulator